MPLGTLGNGLGPYWAVVMPVGKTNLITNPSFELGSTGWSAYGPAGSAVVGTTADLQTFGAWSGSIATQSTSGTAGAVSPSFVCSNGSAYTVSLYMRGKAAVGYLIGVGDSSGNTLVGSTTFTQPGGQGTWQRYSFSFTEPAGATRAVVVRKTSDPTGSPNAFYIDGVQVEQGSITTYLDGDQDGCTWNASPHISSSYRSDQTRAGGSVIALADIGMFVDDATGIGMPPLENSYQSYAILDGAQFQRTRAGVRTFTLGASPLSGTSWQDLHTQRRTLINAFKIDSVNQQQPIRFWYIGAGGTVQIDAVLDAGLEMGQASGFNEALGVRFLAFDPYWESTTQQGTTLAPRTNIGSVLFAAYRDPVGRWGTLGANGSAFDNFVNAILPASNGLVYFAGNFGSAGGTRTRFVAQYDPSTNTFGSLSGGTISPTGGAALTCMTETAPGSILIGGNISQVGGTTANGIVRYNTVLGQFGTLNGGGMNGGGSQVYGISFNRYDNLFYIASSSNLAAGTTIGSVATYNAATDRFGTLRTGVAGGPTLAVAAGLDGKVYFAGQQTTADGTTANSISFYDAVAARWGTMQTGLQAGGVGFAIGNVVGVAANGKVYVGGQFGSAGGGSAQNFAVWNGVSFAGFGSGLGIAGQAVQGLLPLPSGDVLIAGLLNYADTLKSPGPAVRLLQTTFTPFELAASFTMYSIAQAKNGTIYTGHSAAAGSVMTGAVAAVVNSGMAQVYPTIRIRNNTSSGTARLYQLLNATTNDGIFFNIALQPNETATLQLAPGTRSFTSSLRGNIFGNIIPGSNLATWRLLPGTNYINTFADSDNLQTSIFWSPRHWSADAGTTF
jgi:hypothetical protein